MPVDWVHQFITATADWLSTPGSTVHTFQVRAFIALLLVALACGVLGSLVVGNRMAFFSDAMAHTAMAGVTLSLLLLVLLANVQNMRQADDYLWLVPLAMAVFGVVIGLMIAFIQERTALASDTVIGVFFAFSLGFAGLLMPALRKRINLDLEGVLFGQLQFIDDARLLILFGMAAVTCGVVVWKYNSFVFGSFNPVLAKSRGLSVRFNTYLFVALLALVVNLSIYAVGVLLINALLVVPAAAAANVAGNLRRMFWVTLSGCVGCVLVGYRVSSVTQIPLGPGKDDVLYPGPSGAVVVACVGWFFASLGVRAVRRRFFGAAVPCPHTSCSHVHSGGEYPHPH
ncbi:MAG: metal ABC transporter permease [Gemmataceae bacterium]